MFEPTINQRADLTPGALYAVDGGKGWIYYCQVASDKNFGFFRYRSHQLSIPEEILNSPIMCRFAILLPSIGRALRGGNWLKMGRQLLKSELLDTQEMVQWPVGTLTVTVWCGGNPSYDTRVEDPAIQNMEIIAAWDAVSHVPQRLIADFEPESAELHVGGPIWRERRVKEEMARRFPDQHWHQLPADWVRTEAVK